MVHKYGPVTEDQSKQAMSENLPEGMDEVGRARRAFLRNIALAGLATGVSLVLAACASGSTGNDPDASPTPGTTFPGGDDGSNNSSSNNSSGSSSNNNNGNDGSDDNGDDGGDDGGDDDGGDSGSDGGDD